MRELLILFSGLLVLGFGLYVGFHVGVHHQRLRTRSEEKRWVQVLKRTFPSLVYTKPTRVPASSTHPRTLTSGVGNAKDYYRSDVQKRLR